MISFVSRVHFECFETVPGFVKSLTRILGLAEKRVPLFNVGRGKAVSTAVVVGSLLLLMWSGQVAGVLTWAEASSVLKVDLDL